jgi:5-methylcytosine-specific restriction endonuclease McrA
MVTLLKRDGPICRWCREPFTEADPPTFEHIVPKRFGGSNKNENLCLAHRLCNV